MKKRDEESMTQEQPQTMDGVAGDPVSALQAEVEALKNENLKLIAEQRNMQVRAAREREQSLKYAESGFAKDLLGTIDGLEQALQATRGATDVKTVGEGIRIVHEEFLKLLKSRGIQPIAALGKAFDPALHEALAQQPSAEYAAGTVMVEVARGYMMHERVLRATRVIVSSGPEGAAAK